MRSLLLLSVAFALGTTIAQAETFTFSGKSEVGMQVASPGPAGKPVVGGTAKIETEIVWASGGKEKSTGDCVAWSAPPGTAASNLGVCSSTGADGGKSAMFFTCISLNEQNSESDCWGRIAFTSGKNEGKTATVSWRGKQNPDKKGGTAVGAGNMN